MMTHWKALSLASYPIIDERGGDLWKDLRLVRFYGLYVFGV